MLLNTGTAPNVKYSNKLSSTNKTSSWHFWHSLTTWQLSNSRTFSGLGDIAAYHQLSLSFWRSFQTHILPLSSHAKTTGHQHQWQQASMNFWRQLSNRYRSSSDNYYLGNDELCVLGAVKLQLVGNVCQWYPWIWQVDHADAGLDDVVTQAYNQSVCSLGGELVRERRQRLIEVVQVTSTHGWSQPFTIWQIQFTANSQASAQVLWSQLSGQIPTSYNH